jgi:hypothetical protein
MNRMTYIAFFFILGGLTACSDQPKESSADMPEWKRAMIEKQAIIDQQAAKYRNSKSKDYSTEEIK